MKIKRLILHWFDWFLQSRGYCKTKLKSGGYTSETSKCRERLSKHCVGYGVDCGFGGDPITEHAIRVDQPKPYANTGSYPVQLGGDATNLYWFSDEVLDFHYSSHLLEDFENVEGVLKEWWRVLKPGGMLIIFCPDEQAYRKHCAATGQPYNTMHKHADFSLVFVKNALAKFAKFEVVHECPLIDIYSWELVCKKNNGVLRP
jgi:SAM-dependent methyltransferase